MIFLRLWCFKFKHTAPKRLSRVEFGRDVSLLFWLDVERSSLCSRFNLRSLAVLVVSGGVGRAWNIIFWNIILSNLEHHFNFQTFARTAGVSHFSETGWMTFLVSSFFRRFAIEKLELAEELDDGDWVFIDVSLLAFLLCWCFMSSASCLCAFMAASMMFKFCNIIQIWKIIVSNLWRSAARADCRSNRGLWSVASLEDSASCWGRRPRGWWDWARGLKRGPDSAQPCPRDWTRAAW